jgi:hypothetical protein
MSLRVGIWRELILLQRMWGIRTPGYLILPQRCTEYCAGINRYQDGKPLVHSAEHLGVWVGDPEIDTVGVVVSTSVNALSQACAFSSPGRSGELPDCTFVLAQCGNLDGLLTPDLLQDAPTKPLPHQLAEADFLYESA